MFTLFLEFAPADDNNFPGQFNDRFPLELDRKSLREHSNWMFFKERKYTQSSFKTEILKLLPSIDSVKFPLVFGAEMMGYEGNKRGRTGIRGRDRSHNQEKDSLNF